MSDELERDIFRTIGSSGQKYTYFLLTAAGAGIALAANQTDNSAMDLLKVPLAIGVLSWGLSFLFVCYQIQYKHSALNANLDLIKVQKGYHPLTENDPEAIRVSVDILIKVIEEKLEKSNGHGRMQFQFLIAGGFCYIIWHLLEMYTRT